MTNTDLFSAPDNIDFISLTDQLLKKLDDFIPENQTEQFYEDLKSVINFHDKNYYVESNSIITDYDYDRLFKIPEKLKRYQKPKRN